MKKSLFILVCILMSISLMSAEPGKMPIKYDIVVAFGSMASGPSSDAFLKSFTTKFAKKNAVKITGYKAAGCGREGEFNILFSCFGMKSAIKKKFMAELNTAVIAQEKKNKAKDQHSGNISVDYNKTKSDFSHCREAIKLWK